MKKMRENEEKQRGDEGETSVEERRKKNKKERHFPLQSLVNRESKLVEARDKVGQHDESYAWGTRNCGFRRVPKGRGFSYTSYFLPSGHVRAILVQL